MWRGVWLAALIWIGCTEDEKNESLPNQWQAFIVCEGNFGSGNGEITLVDTVESDSTHRRAYFTVNSTKLGDYPHGAWSMATTLLVTVTNSNRVAMVDMPTMERIGTIENVHTPRSGTTDGVLSYVTEFEDSTVAVIDPAAKLVTKRWKLIHKPDEIAWLAGKLFVSAAPGQNDTIISVIDPMTDLIQTVTIGLNPISLSGIPGRSEVYVASAGNSSTEGFIGVVDMTTYSIKSKIGEGENIRPTRVVAQNPNIAFIITENGNVRVQNMESGVTQETDGRNYYNLGWGNGELFALDARDFVGHGEVHWLATDLSIRKVMATDTAPVNILFF